jgi:hypothetical protein
MTFGRIVGSAGCFEIVVARSLAPMSLDRLVCHLLAGDVSLQPLYYLFSWRVRFVF